MAAATPRLRRRSSTSSRHLPLLADLDCTSLCSRNSDSRSVIHMKLIGLLLGGGTPHGLQTPEIPVQGMTGICRQPAGQAVVS